MNGPPYRPAARAAIAAAALLSLAALAGCGGHASEHATGAAASADLRLSPADVVTAEVTDLAAGVPVSGTLEPAVDIRITAPVGDVLDAVPVREGEAVAQGQVLARFRADAIEPAAVSAEAALAVAAADRERHQNLYREGAVSKRDLEAAEAQWRSAEAQASAARKRLAESVVRAPVAGVIAERHVEAGTRRDVGDPMFRLVNTRTLEFEATVPGEHAAAVRRGAPVRLVVSGWAGKAIEGVIARVNAAADPATRQVKLYVSVPNPGGALVGGLYATGTVVTARAAQALAVPLAAVHGAGDSLWVMVVEDGRLARKPVRTGVRDEVRELVQVTAGLAPGAAVVRAPVEGLAPGAAVTRDGGER